MPVVPKIALGKQALSAIHNDIQQTVTPSWVSPAPKNLGLASRGKLSADEYFTACTIHIPITLIRLWGNHPDERKRDMLSNFLDLVNVVQIGAALEMTDDLIKEYQELIVKYLDGMKKLYKESTVKPNHHLAVHLGLDVLPNFGPLHPIRSFNTERNNYMLQKKKTNLKFGETHSQTSWL